MNLPEKVKKNLIGAPLAVCLMTLLCQDCSSPLELPNYSPSTRVLYPLAVFQQSGMVSDAQNVLFGAATRISGVNSYIVLDFGKEVGGLVTLHFAAASDGDQQLGLAFSESSLYVGTNSDLSCGPGRSDGAIYAAAAAASSYTMPADKLRGGFRYLTVFMKTSGWVELDRVSLEITFAPGKADPSDYPNYFYSNDSLLNRIWYAGAYTVQTNTIDPTQGRVWGPPDTGWYNNAVVGVGRSVLTDGAKRDRTIWSGDMGISLLTQYVSTNDLISTRNSLDTLFGAQQSGGELPYAGPQISYCGSDTYHLWTLWVAFLYYSYSADRAWLDSVWEKFKSGMAYSIGKIAASGLLHVTGTSDWARDGQGGENIQANALFYAVLLGGANLAASEGDETLSAVYTAKAAALKAAAEAILWDAAVGLYKDNPSSSIYPQDGNSLAVWFGLADPATQAVAIVNALAGRWNSLGATTPEWGGGIHPFPGSMEVHARFTANDDQRGLDLIRREWGYMLDSPLGTQSTFWEGFNADGSFAYLGNYMSLAHGWATGPTSALTFYVLGLAPENRSAHYRFVPHPGDLTNVQGSLTLPQGTIHASWNRSGANTFSSHLESPAGCTAKVGVPKLGMSQVVIKANGNTVYAAGSATGKVSGLTYAGDDDNYVYFYVTPGAWTFSEAGVNGRSAGAAAWLGKSRSY